MWAKFFKISLKMYGLDAVSIYSSKGTWLGVCAANLHNGFETLNKTKQNETKS